MFGFTKANSVLSIVVLTVAIVFAFGFVNPSVAYASGDGWGDMIAGDDSWGDAIYGDDSWGDSINGDDSWGDAIYGDDSWGDAIYGNDSWGDSIYGNDEWGNTMSGTYYDDETGTYYDDVTGTYYDDVTGRYYDDVDGVYYDDECACYSYGSGSSYGSVGGRSASYGYSSGGYSMVKPMTFGSPSYPTYNPPAKSTGGSSSVSNISNTTITNVDNSIRDSFNNYNSNNVSYVVPATPQYPVVNVQPGPYCQIYQTQASGSGVTAVYLSWTSSNATSAYLSNVGGVSVNGSKTVWPTGSQSYTLTVYGYNGQTATCHANVNTAPYVSLTQIPYTGFDFGTFGNAMYWAGLATFALGAGYLAIYYVPALAIAGMGTRKQYAPVVAPKAPILVEREAVAEKLAPIVNSVRKAGTFDTMAILASKDGSMPKIVIDRS